MADAAAELPGVTDPSLLAWVVELDPRDLVQELVRSTPAITDERVKTPAVGAMLALEGLTDPLERIPVEHRATAAACRTRLIVEAAGVLGLEVRVKEGGA